MSKYRDELIQTIKDCGQEIINRAESMVHDDCDMIGSFEIHIDIPNKHEGAPILNWTTSVCVKEIFNREIGDVTCKGHVDIMTTSADINPKFTL